MVSTNQCFYPDTISRKTATQGWRVLSIHETDYPPPDANPVFESLGEVIIDIIVITIFIIIIIIVAAVVVIIIIVREYFYRIKVLLLFKYMQVKKTAINTCPA